MASGRAGGCPFRLLLLLTALLAAGRGRAQAERAEAAPPTGAEERQLERLGSLSLEDLLTKVRVASTREEEQGLAASVISVIDRPRIERLGARTLQELLRAVEGFDVKQSEYNDWIVGLRGYDTAANFLVLVDGQRLNDAYDGSVRWDLPLDEVERVEIIRGPGSAIYGTNAFAGVISLQTFSDRAIDRVRLTVGNDDDQFGHFVALGQPLVGGSFRLTTRLDALRLQLHATARMDSGDKLLVPSDSASLEDKPWSLARCLDGQGHTLLSGGQPILRYAACQAAGGVWGGRTQEQVNQGSLAAQASLGNFEWTFRIDADGRGPKLIDLDTQHLILNYQSFRKQWSWFTQARQRFSLGEAGHLAVRAFFDERRHEENLGLEPPGFATNGVTFPDGWMQTHKFTSRSAGAEAVADGQFELGGLGGALSLLGGAGADWRQVTNGQVLTNFTLAGPRPPAEATQGLPGLVDDQTGSVVPECVGGSLCTDQVHESDLSLFGQAQWRPGLGVSGLSAAVTAGLRLDDQSTSLPGGQVLPDGRSGFRRLVASPRAGLTLVLDDDRLPLAESWVRLLLPDNLKLLYGSAFRAPTIKERYDNLGETFQGNPALVDEQIDSFEMALGYRLGKNASLSANAFHSTIQHSIQRLSESSGIEPLRQQASRVVEGLEATTRFSWEWVRDAFANVSLLRGTDTGNVPGFNQPITTHLDDQPSLHANAGAEVRLHGPLHLGVYGRYVSIRGSLQRTVTEQVHHFAIDRLFVMDAALRLLRPLPGLTVELYAYNLFGTRYRDPLYHDSDVVFSPGAPSDLLPRGGLSMMARATYRLDLRSARGEP